MRRAFSLIEMVIVAAIVALIAAVAIPRYTASLNTFRAQGTAQAVASLIREAQARARAGSASTSIALAGTTGVRELDHSGAKVRELSLGTSGYNAAIVGYNLGGDTQLTFDGFGKPDSAAAIQVCSGAANYKVIVDTEGRVSVTTAVAIVVTGGSGSSGTGSGGASGTGSSGTGSSGTGSSGTGSSGSSGDINVNLGGLSIGLGSGGASIQLN